MKRNARWVRLQTWVALASGLLASGTAAARQISLADVEYKTNKQTKIKKVKVAGAPAIKLAGGDNAVTLTVGAPSKKKSPPATVTSFSVGLQHVDAGPHAFNLAFGKLGAVKIQCDAVKSGDLTGAVKIQCDAVKPGDMAGDMVKPGDFQGTFTPSFAGATTYTAKVYESGNLIQTHANHAGSFTVPNFDTVHDGREETIGFDVTYGKERAGAWTMTITHEQFTIVITPDSDQAPMLGPIELALSTAGLDSLTLTQPTAKLAK